MLTSSTMTSGPILNGIQATRRILASRGDARILAVSLHTDQRLVAAALEAGAKGFLVKEGLARELVRAVRAVAEGSTYLSKRLGTGVGAGSV